MFIKLFNYYDYTVMHGQQNIENSPCFPSACMDFRLGKVNGFMWNLVLYISLHVKYPLFSTDCEENYIFDKFSNDFQYQFLE